MPVDLDPAVGEADVGDREGPRPAEAAPAERSAVVVARPNGLLVAVYALLAAAFLWPVPIRPNRLIYGYGGDNFGFIYDLDSGRTNPLLFWRSTTVDSLSFPDGYVESNWVRLTSVLPDTVAWPMARVVGSIATYNFLVYIGLVLTALAACWLFSYTTSSRLVGFWGGLAFTLFPFIQQAATAWPSFTHMYWLPLVVLASFHYRDAPSARRLVVLPLLIVGAGLTNPYVAFFCVAVLVACAVVWGPPALAAFRALTRAARRRLITVGAATVAVVLGLVAAFVVVLRGSIERDTSDLDVYGLRLSELFRPTTLQEFSSEWIVPIGPESFHGSNTTEIAQFVGWSTIVLALIGLLSPRSGARQGRQRALSLVGIGLGLFMAMSNQVVLGLIPTPGRILHEVAPFFRVYSRFGVVIFLFLMMLAVHGVALLVRGRSRGTQALVVGTLCVVSFVELWAPLPGRTTEVERPEFTNAIAGDSDPVVAFYPIVRSDDGYFYEQELWTLYLPPGTRMVNGGPTDLDSEDLRNQLLSLNSDQTWRDLDALGVEYVVLDTTAYAARYGHDVARRDGAIYEDARFVVYRLDAVADGAVAWTAGDQSVAEVREDGPSWRWIGGEEGRVVVRSTSDACVAVSGSVGAPDGNTAITFTPPDGSVVVDDDGDDRFRLVLGVPAGTTTVGLDPVRDAAQLTETDQRVAALYVSDLAVIELDAAACG